MLQTAFIHTPLLSLPTFRICVLILYAKALQIKRWASPGSGVPNMGGGTITHEGAFPPHQDLSPPIQKKFNPPHGQLGPPPDKFFFARFAHSSLVIIFFFLSETRPYLEVLIIHLAHCVVNQLKYRPLLKNCTLEIMPYWFSHKSCAILSPIGPLSPTLGPPLWGGTCPPPC